jgi:hypothetical protein
MSAFVVHFPDGSKEFRFPSEPLKEGDAIWHEGARYRVLHVTSHDGAGASVTVERAPDDIGDMLRSEQGGIMLVPVD